MSHTVSRRLFTSGALATAVGLALAACSKNNSGLPGGAKKNGDTVVISVGATPQPHVTILQYVQDNLVTGSGISLDIVEINDYQTPNYLAQQIADKGFDFVSIADVHIEPMGLYSSTITSVDQIPNGGKIILNSDPANAARGLQLLVQAGLIELDSSVELPSETDVTSNPKNLTFTFVDGAQVARSMTDADAAVINGNYAIEAGLVPSEDALVLETAENSPYVNQLVVRTEDKDDEHLATLAKLITSPEVKTFIETTWSDGSVIPAF